MLCKEEDLLQCLQLLSRDMCLYEVPLFMSLLVLRMGTMLAHFHMCGFIFKHTREECESKRAHGFSVPDVWLSGPFE